MYKSFEHIKDPEERRCLESLNHPHGEEYQGQYDYERQYLRDRGYDEYEDEEEV